MVNSGELPALTDAQQEVMSLVWQYGQCSVADVWSILDQRRGVSRNTVHTLMVRLEKKDGWNARYLTAACFFQLPFRGSLTSKAAFAS